MKCYDCGGEMAAGTEKCASCGCPAARSEAVGWMEERLRQARTQSEAARGSLTRARSALFATALLALAAGAIELLNAQGERVRMRVGIAMLLLGAGFAALAFALRRWPLVVAAVALGASLFFLNGVLGLLVVGVAALGAWFAVHYAKATGRERTLRKRLAKLK